MSSGLSRENLFSFVGWWRSIVGEFVRLSAIEVVLDYIGVDFLEVWILIVSRIRWKVGCKVYVLEGSLFHLSGWRSLERKRI